MRVSQVWQWLIHVRFRIEFYALKIERSWHIHQDQNTHTPYTRVGTWTREYNPYIYIYIYREREREIKDFQTQEIQYSTCVVLVSICYIINYLPYFCLLFIGILIVSQLHIEIFFFLEGVYCKSQNLNFKIQTPILHKFSIICISDIAMTRM